ncbi:TerC family protein [Serratia sp. CY74664]|uniref:TerC family protein n=1 Tax=Serratia sp. CY74664 TaxID=3383676 RepID=UPI003F9F5E6F
MFEWIMDPNAWLALGTLTILEIVLGIDNIIFLSLVVAKLPKAQQNKARRIGLAAAMLMRLALLASIAWVIRLTHPLFTVMEHSVSARDLILLLGGLFLIWKASKEIHETIEGSEEEHHTKVHSFFGAIVQIMLLDIIFSLDSVITAVGLSDHLFIMMAAVVIAVGVMMFAARPIGEFVNRHPSVKMLALAFLFLLGVLCVVAYAIINSPGLGLVAKPLMNTTNAILIIMLSVATLTTLLCRVDTDMVLNSSTFKAGMSACICILGVAWLGDTFVQANIDWIKETAGSVIQAHPWLLAVIFFFCSALLYSQAATAKALMPMALALNVSPLTAVASFAAVSGLFILPTYPTLVAAVQMDDTGTTRIGRFVFNHPFFIPGTMGVIFAVVFGFLLGSIML